MTLRQDLTDLLARYDDEAWAALASRGLLRRATKNLAATTPTLRSESDDAVEVGVGEHVVRFDGRGPSEAACSCPTAGTCQHVVTAGLWLAGQASPGDPSAVDPHVLLMAFGEDALVAHAGRAGLRWARQLVVDLDPEDVRVGSGERVHVALPSPHVTFRFMGGGLAGVVPDVDLPHVARYQVAAVLAYQRAHGIEVVAAEAAPAPGDLAGSLDDTRLRLRAAARRLLVDTVRLGLSHPSPSLRERYETVAVWAAGAEYHRLALLLRRLGDHVDMLLARSARADEQMLLDEAALAFALVTALEATPASPRLTGRARGRYDAAPTMTLVGLGALPWRAASGYRGLTCLFWWAEESRFVSWSDTRPEDLRGFDARRRYELPGPWTGLPSPAAASGQLVRLTGARVSPAGRVSGAESTHAVPGPLRADLVATIPTVTSWADLDQGAGGRSLLDVADPLRDWMLLRPSGFRQPAFFDAARQTLVWPALDDTGRVLPVEVRWTPESAHTVQRVESLGDGLADGASLVCRVGRPGGRLVAEPLSVLHDDGRVDVLAFDEAAGPTVPLRQGVAPDEAVEPVSALPAVLRDLRAWLVAQSERGTGAGGPVLPSLEQRHAAARAAGFGVFAPPTADLDPAEALLRSAYVLLQTTALVGGTDSGRAAALL